MEKEEIVRACRKELEERIDECRRNLMELQADLTAESKSTAGDKHETGRAMIHLEAEKEAGRLKEAESLLAMWERIDFLSSYQEVLPGAMVHTDNGIFLNAVAAGKVEWQGKQVFILSPLSPLMKAMTHKKIGDVVCLPQQNYMILNIE